jgi:hypothetical protein
MGPKSAASSEARPKIRQKNCAGRSANGGSPAKNSELGRMAVAVVGSRKKGRIGSLLLRQRQDNGQSLDIPWNNCRTGLFQNENGGMRNV